MALFDLYAGLGLAFAAAVTQTSDLRSALVAKAVPGMVGTVLLIRAAAAVMGA